MINHWISTILLFNFQLHHVSGHAHGPDSLSQCLQASKNPVENYKEWINLAILFFYKNTMVLCHILEI